MECEGGRGRYSVRGGGGGSVRGEGGEGEMECEGGGRDGECRRVRGEALVGSDGGRGSSPGLVVAHVHLPS